MLAQFVGGNATRETLAEGDVVGPYTLMRKIGAGRFANVWTGRDTAGNIAAVKIYTSNDVDDWRNEAKVFALAGQCDQIVRYNGVFTHVVFADNGAPDVLPCISFGLAQCSLSAVLKELGALPPDLVRVIMRQVFLGLERLHARGITHADIKPGNILLSVSAEEIRAMIADKTPFDAIEVMLADMGSSSVAPDVFSMSAGSYVYLAPEMILGRKYDTSVDIWAALAMCFELLFGMVMFDVIADSPTTYGDVDGLIVKNADIAFGAASQSKSRSTSEGRAKVTESHSILIEMILGPNDDFARGCERLSIYDLIRLNNPDMPDNYVAEFAEFLALGIRYENRATATDVLRHPWIHDKK